MREPLRTDQPAESTAAGLPAPADATLFRRDVERVLALIRPSVQEDGGDIELVEAVNLQELFEDFGVPFGRALAELAPRGLDLAKGGGRLPPAVHDTMGLFASFVLQKEQPPAGGPSQ